MRWMSRSRSFSSLLLPVLGAVGIAATFSLASCSDDDCAATSSCEGMQMQPAQDGGSGGDETGATAIGGPFSFRPIDPQPRVTHDSSLTVVLGVVRDASQREDIVVTVANLPVGVTVEPLTIKGADSKGELVVKVAASAKQGPFDVTVEGATSKEKASTKLSLFVRGKPGTLDTTFGTEGKRAVLGPSLVAPAQLIVGPNDALYFTGDCPSQPSQGTCVARLSADGTVDTTYGGLSAHEPLQSPLATALDSKGRLVVGGGPGVPIIIRFTAAGQPDTAFGNRDATSTNPLLDPPSEITGVLIGADDAIYVTYFGGDLCVVRQVLNTGVMNGGWGVGYGSSSARWLGGTGTFGPSRPSGMALRPGGAKLIVGGVWEQGGTRGFGISQFEAATGGMDYTFDPSYAAKNFVSTTAVNASPRTVVALPDGRVVVGASAGTSNQSLAMFTAAGVPDTSFGNGTGVATVGFGSGVNLTDVVRTPDGTFILGKSDGLARILSNGALDPSFGQAGVSFVVGGSVALQSDGRIVVASLETGKYYVTRVWN